MRKTFLAILFALAFSAVLPAAAIADMSAQQRSKTIKIIKKNAAAALTARSRSAALSVAKSDPQQALSDVDSADGRACLAGSDIKCRTVWARIVKNLQRLLSVSRQLSKSFRLFNPNAVAYSMKLTQGILKLNASN